VSTPLAAMSDAVVILRVSRSREESAGFLSQGVRDYGDLQRCKSLCIDPGSIDLRK
jgi:hypothetical protein